MGNDERLWRKLFHSKGCTTYLWLVMQTSHSCNSSLPALVLYSTLFFKTCYRRCVILYPFSSLKVSLFCSQRDWDKIKIKRFSYLGRKTINTGWKTVVIGRKVLKKIVCAQMVKEAIPLHNSPTAHVENFSLILQFSSRPCHVIYYYVLFVVREVEWIWFISTSQFYGCSL